MIELVALRGRKIAYLLSHPLAARAFRKTRTAPSIELLPLLHGVHPNSVADVGASRGQFTLLALEELSVERVMAFEPLPDAAADYARLFGDDPRVTLVQRALGETTEVGQLHVSAADDSSSLYQIAPAQVESFPGTHEVGVESVQVSTLALEIDKGWLIPPALLKIDVQGAELEVLRGSGDYLQHFQWVLVEVSFDELYRGQPLAGDVVSWLLRRGFVIHRAATSNNGRGVPTQADILFQRQDDRGPSDVD